MNGTHSIVVQLNTITSTWTTVTDLTVDFDSSAEYPGVLSLNVYQENVDAVVASSLGPLIIEIVEGNVTRSLLYPKDTYFLGMVSITNCSLGQYAAGNFCKTCPIGSYAAQFELPEYELLLHLLIFQMF
jgi:hypothetical protein